MAVIKIERGVGSGSSFFIDNKAILGRDVESNNSSQKKEKNLSSESIVLIPIIDKKASRKHAEIYKKDNSFYIKDLNSKNGTYLNGRPIEKEERLEPGDYIRIGFTWLSFGEELEIEKIARKLPSYEILQKIGEGRTGLYFKVRQKGLDRVVTLNLLPPKIIKNNPQLKEKFQIQAEALARLNHENISIMLDFEESENYLFFTTEYVEGDTLYNILARGKSNNKKIPLEEAIEIGISIAKALAHAHSKEVVHQDINPLNVTVCERRGVRRIILGGFGIASILSEVKDKFSGLIGKVEYLSPEQIENKKVDFRSDIFSFGALFYEILTGVPPFTGDTPEEIEEAILNDTQPAITTYNPDVPAEIENIIYQCLEKEPSQRPKSFKKIAEDLEEILTKYKVMNLKNDPNIYTSGTLYFLVKLLEDPIFIWFFFPTLSIILILLLALLTKS